MTEKFEWYHTFVKKDYNPDLDRDIIVAFKVTPSNGFSIEDAAGRIASESSTGTWTTLSILPGRIHNLMAKAYEMRKLQSNTFIVKVAYPIELFEEGNIPGFLASVAGNIYGMKAIRGLRIEDIYFPKAFIKSFKGPVKGIENIRKIYNIYDRPIVGTVPKPKVGFSPDELHNIIYEYLVGGMDYTKDDENLTGQSFCRFEERARAIVKAIDRAEKETGERKIWLANVTADIRDMEKRIKLVADYGNPFIMVDVVIVGWSALTYIRDLAEEYSLAIHAHRAFHAAFTRNPLHGLSMFTLAKLYRLVGIDQLHIGTPEVGKLEAKTSDVINNARILRERHYRPDADNIFYMEQEWHHIKPVFPTASGGLHPGILPEVIKILGMDIVIQVGGGVLGHPDGPMAGAKAVRQVIDACLRNIPIDQYAEKNKELRRALEKWSYIKPA